MMNKQINNWRSKWLGNDAANKGDNLNEFPLIVDVEKLESYDMRWVYHHLSLGRDVKLAADFNTTEGNEQVAVYYKNHKLGYLSMKGGELIRRMLFHGFDLKARIVNVVRQKYMPARAIQIEVCENQLIN